MSRIPRALCSFFHLLEARVDLPGLDQLQHTKIWKQPKCPSVDEWIKKLWYIYMMEYYSSIKKQEILPFATAWTDQESLRLSEISQLEKDKYHIISLICGI